MTSADDNAGDVPAPYAAAAQAHRDVLEATRETVAIIAELVARAEMTEAQAQLVDADRITFP